VLPLRPVDGYYLPYNAPRPRALARHCFKA
jgi:hypothetical protein